jgi:hypothetical protein
MYSNLKDAEIERLAKLAEECGEIIQMVGKTLVHGWGSFHPRFPEEGTNREKLEKEIGGLACVIDMMIAAGDVSENSIMLANDQKTQTIGKYLHHQEVYEESN